MYEKEKNGAQQLADAQKLMDEEYAKAQSQIQNGSDEYMAAVNEYNSKVVAVTNGKAELARKESEYNNKNMINPRVSINTTYKTIVSTMAKLTNTFRYKVSVAWNIMPSKRSYDIILSGFFRHNHCAFIFFRYRDRIIIQIKRCFNIISAISRCSTINIKFGNA